MLHLSKGIHFFAVPALLAGGLVFTAFIGGCSSMEKSQPGGIGGQMAGGAGGSPCALVPAISCIPSCALPVDEVHTETCDVNTGTATCQDGWVPESGCAPGTCARQDNGYCCDFTTGDYQPPACQPDGFVAQCPGGTRAASGGCIPDGLGTTRCPDLNAKSCAMAGQKCMSDATICVCDPGDGGLTWSCETTLI
jgi:hypothetical protein